MLLLRVLAVLLTAYGAYTDYRFGILRVRLSKIALLSAPLLTALVEWFSTKSWAVAQAGAIDSVLAIVLCGVTPVMLYRLKSLGRGDLWLLPAVGGLLGLRAGVEGQMLIYVLALVLAPAKLVYEGRLFRTIGESFTLVTNLFRKPAARKPVPAVVLSTFPLGPYIFLGTLVEVFFLHVGDFLHAG